MKKKHVIDKRYMFGAMCMFLFLTCFSKEYVRAEISYVLGNSIENYDRSLVCDVEAVSDKAYMRVRYGHLNYGFVELRKVSPTRVRISATTQAHHVCPEIYTDIYVDKYDVDTKTWNQWRYWEYSTTNSQHLTKNMEIIVPSGYYYSVRGYHSCIHGDIMESTETMTDGIYIGTTDKPIL